MRRAMAASLISHSQMEVTGRESTPLSHDYWEVFQIPGSGSSNFSLSLGKAGRRDSGYFRNTLYMIKTAFFLM